MDNLNKISQPDYDLSLYVEHENESMLCPECKSTTRHYPAQYDNNFIKEKFWCISCDWASDKNNDP